MYIYTGICKCIYIVYVQWVHNSATIFRYIPQQLISECFSKVLQEHHHVFSHYGDLVDVFPQLFPRVFSWFETLKAALGVLGGFVWWFCGDKNLSFFFFIFVNFNSWISKVDSFVKQLYGEFILVDSVFNQERWEFTRRVASNNQSSKPHLWVCHAASSLKSPQAAASGYAGNSNSNASGRRGPSGQEIFWVNSWRRKVWSCWGLHPC